MGEPGLTGPFGNPGLRGDRGLPGERGLPGPLNEVRGEKGDQGKHFNIINFKNLI